MRAHDAVCALLVSMWNGGSRVFDKNGRMLARAHWTRDADGIIALQITIAEVDPISPRKWVSCPDLRRLFANERQPHVYGTL
jgi:predicted amidohydrolase